MDAPTHARIGELLVEAHLLDEATLHQALRAQQLGGGVIGEHLVRLGAVDDDTLLRMLSRQTQLQHVNLTRIEIPAEVQRLLKLETVRARRVVPLALEGSVLVLGVVKPDDHGALAHVQLETGRAVRPVLVSAAQHARALSLLERLGWAQQPFRLPAQGEAEPEAHAQSSRELRDLLGLAVERGAQALCLTAGAIPALKIGGELHRIGRDCLGAGEVERVVAPYLTAAHHDRFTADLELDFALVVPGVGRFRCNLFRQRGEASLVARRVLERVPSFGELGLPAFLHDLALAREGLVVIAGPAGHGKTTTLAAMVDVINHERRANVVTVEDPIEYLHQHQLSNVNQREVGPDVPSIADGLRHVLHQSPDVIAIGELRDHESAQLALHAAESGHLVLTTMRAPDPLTSVDRLIDLFPAAEHRRARAQLADVLLCLYAQRLLERASGGGRELAWARVGTSPQTRAAVREGAMNTLRRLVPDAQGEVEALDASLARLVTAGRVTHDEAAKYAQSPAFLDDSAAITPPAALDG